MPATPMGHRSNICRRDDDGLADSITCVLGEFSCKTVVQFAE